MSLSKTILRNTISNWIGILSTTLVTILLTPYLLKYLGDERYGIYQIVLPIVTYLVLLELGIRGSVARFCSKYIHEHDDESLNSILTTAVFFGAVLGVVVICLCLFLGFLAPRFFEISETYRYQTLFMFVGLGINTVVSLLSYAFAGIMIGHSRYDLANVRLILRTVFNAVLVVIFFRCGWVSLSAWASAIAISALTGLLFSAALAYYIHPGISLRLKFIRARTIKEVFGFSMWNMLIQLSYFLGLNANSIIIGYFIGPGTVPYYAIPMMLTNRLQGFVGGLTSTLVPAASSAMTSGNTLLLQQLLQKGTYVSSILVFPLGGVLLVMCRSLFRVWLPAGYEDSWVVYAVLMIGYWISITQTTSYHTLLGGGNIKGLGLSYLTSAVIGVGLSIYWVGYLRKGIVAAATAMVIPQFLLMGLFQAWYASSQVKLRFWQYLRASYARPALCALPSMLLGWLLARFVPPRDLISWAIEYVVALVPFGILALTKVLDWPLRTQIMGKLKSFFT